MSYSSAANLEKNVNKTQLAIKPHASKPDYK